MITKYWVQLYVLHHTSNRLSNQSSRFSLICLTLMPHIMRYRVTSPYHHLRTDTPTCEFNHILDRSQRHVAVSICAPVLSTLRWLACHTILRTAAKWVLAKCISTLQVLQIYMQVSQLHHLETKNLIYYPQSLLRIPRYLTLSNFTPLLNTILIQLILQNLINVVLQLQSFIRRITCINP